MKQVLPYAESTASKKEQVSHMFDDISPKYDLLNKMLSMGIDRQWRRKVVKLLRKEHPANILDIATGTADLAIALRKTGAKEITGVDISPGMLSIGREKVRSKGLMNLIKLEVGDSEELRFADNSFDAATVAFGVRNFENLKAGLKDIHRVLKPGATLAVLEFSQPQHFPFRQLYNFYFHNVLPFVGRMVSRNSSAYTYLPQSVSQFPFGDDFAAIMAGVGFNDIQWQALTFGICTLYWGKKQR